MADDNDMRRPNATGATACNTMSINKVDRFGEVDTDEDELSMPIVVSDVLQPSRRKTTMPSLSPSGKQQTPRGAKMSQAPALSPGQPSQTPSQMRLAVHIKSLPVTPFTPINAPASRTPSALPSRLGQSQGRPAKSDTPKSRPSTSEGPGLGMKKRGRPKGWKPGMAYSTNPKSKYRRRAEATVAADSPSQGRGQEPKRRGRPPRALEASVRERYLRSKPDYTPYKCEWTLPKQPGQQKPSVCPAELHNMETLRRHVSIIHGDADSLVCRYSRCSERTLPLRFATVREFKDHMEKKHFAWYLWHMGEGYQNNSVSTRKHEPNTAPAYLFDEHGNQVTPSVASQRLESELEYKERKRRLKRLLYLQNENAPSEEEWKKQMLGDA
ncbi:hypothetical protein F5Y19DRAFT_203944 [Xylariaceae sp. FL1651]|nr:hypothetical protein F5Y19DRAFT_203944 [Xylariaceae sp. FL1651]